MTREEAIKAIKAWDFLNNDEKEVIETLIPELKESEDERIRKELIKLMRQISDTIVENYTTVPISDFVAWLEKQGDKDKLIKELGEYKVKYTQEVLENHLKIMNKDDERLRKTTIDFLKDFADKGYENAVECIGWLEKQGEQNHKIQPKFKIGDIIRFKGNEILKGEAETHKIVGYDNELYVFDDGTTDLFCEQDLYELVEQKPNDKVEPKFHEGEWIVNNISQDIYLIKSINNGYYTLEDTKGNIISPCLPPCESESHLWTIEDAKDGDVLVDVYGNIGIFEKRYGYNWHTYCYLGNEGRLVPEGGSHGSICYPATKEQRDLLFQKMKEAGYEWDAEKLELIKVPKTKEPEGTLKQLLDEQKKFYEEAKIVLEDKDTALAFLRRTGIIDEYGELAEKYRSDQTPATTISAVNGACSTAITDGNTSVTSKEVERQYCTGQYESNVREFPIEWSEEDERMCQYIVDDLGFVKELVNDPHYVVSVERVEKEIDWLKSLKDRYTWKLSNEQMDNLSRAFNGATYRTSLLRDLYLDLKKLKGE